MIGCCGDWTWSGWSWWWVVPLVGMALCMTFCILARSGRAGRGVCCWHGRWNGDPKDLQDEIGNLRKEMGDIRKRQGEDSWTNGQKN